MRITSTNFQEGETIPVKYSAFGDNINPALTFSEIPDNTQSLVLILEDPDTPHGLFTHWTIFNMSPATLQITEDNVPISGTQGTSDAGQHDYFGPKPPEGSGNHRYIFKLFALDEMLDITQAITPDELRDVIADHIIEQTELIGMFSYEDKDGE